MSRRSALGDLRGPCKRSRSELPGELDRSVRDAQNQLPATTLKAAASTAEALVDKLMQLGALRPDGPTRAAALQDAITALKPRYPATEVDAFRVYVP